ncbi:MAG TPA: phosphoadenylyl-sulfate reductase [Microvirga sp.]|jgi:phosphoadenosine phosphosulfate reductase|nr:phosphoadenylyl-sulfate reductase [Microvirga sp.]
MDLGPPLASPGSIAAALEPLLAQADLPHRLAALARHMTGRIVFTTSFGLEDQAITHAVWDSDLDLPIEIVTLDTGRLFPETYDLWHETETRYGRRIRAFAPDSGALETLVAAQGVNGFRGSVEARKACCHVRKVEPLRRALAGASAWITGLRAEQSPNRAGVPLAEADAGFGLVKVNPLADWRRDDLTRYVRDHAVPYNPLHDQGYPSIGCQPCTRAVRVGEPERAGRWWWEDEARKECGLHVRTPLRDAREGERLNNPHNVSGDLRPS